jgi:hypothetical protein
LIRGVQRCAAIGRSVARQQVAQALKQFSAPASAMRFYDFFEGFEPLFLLDTPVVELNVISHVDLFIC